jgi:hypothetical protein
VVALTDGGSSQNFIGQRLAYDWHLGAGEEPPAGPKTVDGTPLRVFRSCLLEFRQRIISLARIFAFVSDKHARIVYKKIEKRSF